MTTLNRILNAIFIGTQSRRDRAALRAHRDAFLGKPGKFTAAPACFYSF
ncbi:hypothetical protein SAMN05216227_10065 [Pseudorhodobacter antarcticus]|jgi:hypothetical protein|uniref:Uncharacterized protein n=1 Tax=Pseudorhodobacter antarcticus TaxID=1077947 RepID=A0A1H8CYN9_9RHOB|nr:hypothetical protein [Pseudorhodobacter antarcticus]SEN00146.1 hypothetical protein SAMN05216227_10065 [Pseudorhodobacter antarcticus]